MNKRASLPTTSRHIGIYDEDWEFLDRLYGPRGTIQALGIARVVREILHSKVKELRQKLIDRQDQLGEQRGGEAAEMGNPK